jgi:SAM-dependent methyltransferase
MTTLSPRFWEVFFDVYDHLPRQGPGNKRSAQKALSQCNHLPSNPKILDMGCGVGGQTIQLSEITSGHITALDIHETSIKKLRNTIEEKGLTHRMMAIVADMAKPGLPARNFDLIWSEGALYSIGLRPALQVCYELLKPGGYLVFTDAIWRKENAPDEVRQGFELDYPTMGWLEDDLTLLDDLNFKIITHFTLPDEAWWDDFYTPMIERIAELRPKYASDAEATSILDQIACEPELHRKYAEFYAYEYFVVRRPEV